MLIQIQLWDHLKSKTIDHILNTTSDLLHVYIMSQLRTWHMKSIRTIFFLSFSHSLFKEWTVLKCCGCLLYARPQTPYRVSVIQTSFTYNHSNKTLSGLFTTAAALISEMETASHLQQHFFSWTKREFSSVYGVCVRLWIPNIDQKTGTLSFSKM